MKLLGARFYIPWRDGYLPMGIVQIEVEQNGTGSGGGLMQVEMLIRAVSMGPPVPGTLRIEAAPQ